MSEHDDTHAADSVAPLTKEGTNGLFLAIAAATGVSGLLSFGAYFSGDSSTQQQFFFSYLTAFVFALTLGLGGLFWTMIHHLADAGWSVVIRRMFENLVRTLPFLLLLFLPIYLLGVNTLYEWSNTERFTSLPEDDDVRKMWEAKQFYLNHGFFYFRAFIFWGVWLFFGYTMVRLSRLQDETGDVSLTKKMQWYAPLGILTLGLSATFFAFDYLMGLDFFWYSTMYGVWFWAASILGSLSMCTLIVVLMRAAGNLRNTIRVDHIHDMAKLMFGFTVFWTYISFAQYFLIWYANLPEETRFFKIRQSGAWHHFGHALALGHFAIPFFFLMPRTVKRTPFLVGLAAVWILVFHYCDLYYQIMPNLHREDIEVSWLDVSCLVFTVGVVALSFLNSLRTHPLICIKDPRLEESKHFHNDTIDN